MGTPQDQLPLWPSHLVPTAPRMPLLVADTDTYRALAKGIHELTLVTWDVAPEADPPRIADLAASTTPLTCCGRT